MDFVASEKINYWPTPAESPNLNLIEMLWHEVKHFLLKVYEPHLK